LGDIVIASVRVTGFVATSIDEDLSTVLAALTKKECVDRAREGRRGRGQ
jgi:hypothetical protein